LAFKNSKEYQTVNDNDLLGRGEFCIQHSAQTRYQYLAYHLPCTFLTFPSQICNTRNTPLYHSILYNAHYELRQAFMCTYFCSRKSIMKVDGFPTTIGSLSVDPHMAATIHPAPRITSKNLMLWQPSSYSGQWGLRV